MSGAIITHSVVIRAIVASECIASAAPLLREHWDEIARNKAVMKLNPNVPAYRDLEARGVLLSLGAFDDAGQMVGYVVSIVAPHLHYADLVCCQNDVIFVTRSRRHEGVGQQLIDETERMARRQGAGLVCWHAKNGTALDNMLFDRSYGVQDVVYSREL